MKLQPNAKKLTRVISVGTCVCSLLMVGVFGLLHLFNVYPFTYTVLTGAAAGSLITILNFVLMCLSIQIAANTEDAKQRRSKLQLSYNGRMVLQAGWVVAAFLLRRWFQPVAAALPLLFPTIVIVVLRRSGKLNEPSERKNETVPEEEETV